MQKSLNELLTYQKLQKPLLKFSICSQNSQQVAWLTPKKMQKEKKEKKQRRRKN